MFRKIDCVRLHVPDLEEALAFYRDKLGHSLIWRRGKDSAGLRMPGSDAELVLVAEGEGVEVDFLVVTSDEAVQGF